MGGIVNANEQERAAALVVALSSMAEELASMSSGADAFTCDEADAVARVLVLSGHVEHAATFLAGHASGDDEVDFDRHQGITSPERAREYLVDHFAVEPSAPDEPRHPARAAHLTLRPAGAKDAPGVAAPSPAPPPLAADRSSPSARSRPIA